jgi:hypothetical protein
MEYLTLNGYKVITNYFRENPATTNVPARSFVLLCYVHRKIGNANYSFLNSKIFERIKYDTSENIYKYYNKLDIPGKIWRLHHEDYLEQERIKLEKRKLETEEARLAIEQKRFELEELNQKHLIALLDKLTFVTADLTALAEKPT